MVTNKDTRAKMRFTPTIGNLVQDMSDILQGVLSAKENYEKPIINFPQVSTTKPYLNDFVTGDYDYIDPKDLSMFDGLTVHDKAVITSGLRSIQDNTSAYRTNLTSMIDSPHMTGNSVDIRTRTGKDGNAGRALWAFFKTPSGEAFLRKNDASAYYHDAGTGYHIDITKARNDRPAGKVYEKNKKGEMIIYSPGQAQVLENINNQITKKERKSIEGRLTKVSEYNDFIETAAAKYGMRADHLKIIMGVESGGKPEASSGVAFGLMQVVKSTWDGIQESYPELSKYDFETYRYNPEINILFGAAALKNKAEDMGVKPNDPNFLILAGTAYNAGQGTVLKAMTNAQAGGSKNPGQDFILEEYMKPAIRHYKLFTYNLSAENKAKFKKGITLDEKIINDAIDKKYKEISRYKPKLNQYFEILNQ